MTLIPLIIGALGTIPICNILTFDRAFNQETGASGRRYRNITLTCGRVEFGADATPTGSRWMSNNYIIRCHRRFGLVGVRGRQSCSHSSSSIRSWGQDTVVRASARQRAWALWTPVERPSRMSKKCYYNTEEIGINMWQSVPSPTHLSHITNINPFATLSRIKCERYIFLKKCVRSSLLLTMFPCIVVYVLCGYTTYRLGTGSGGVGNRKTSRDHQKHSINKIGENTEKIPRDPGKLKFQKKPSANADVKNSNE